MNQLFVDVVRDKLAHIENDIAVLEKDEANVRSVARVIIDRDISSLCGERDGILWTLQTLTKSA